MFKQLEVCISPFTIEAWFNNVADLMQPTYYRLRELIQSTNYIQSYKTTVPIINNEKHRTVKGYLWLVRSMVNGLIFFAYNEGPGELKWSCSSSRIIRDPYRPMAMPDTTSWNNWKVLQHWDVGYIPEGTLTGLYPITRRGRNMPWPWPILACFMTWRAWQTTSIWIPSSAWSWGNYLPISSYVLWRSGVSENRGKCFRKVP